jgi:hypothetical protein
MQMPYSNPVDDGMHANAAQRPYRISQAMYKKKLVMVRLLVLNFSLLCCLSPRAVSPLPLGEVP